MKLSRYKMLKLTQDIHISVYIYIYVYCVLVEKRDILYHVFDHVSDICVVLLSTGVNMLRNF